VSEVPLLVVDAANVVGSVPDGWWRDRRGATERLRDALAPIATAGLAVAAAQLAAPIEIVMVVEGAARGVTSRAEVGVIAAPGSGDDAIVAVVRDQPRERVCAVVTADRELRSRVAELGALVVSPRHVHRPGGHGAIAAPDP
jgi:hypothetical protein